MTRSQEIENIIVGTILNTFDDCDWMKHTRSCITPDMMQDEVNKKIYSLAVELYDAGSDVITPLQMTEYCTMNGIDYKTILPKMLELASDYCYSDKMSKVVVTCEFYGKDPPRVKFDDYIKQFIVNTFKSAQDVIRNN